MIHKTSKSIFRIATAVSIICVAAYIGYYRISGLNPNSSYHLSLKINYPNDFDKEMGKAEKRAGLGSLIFIHGKAVTIGCVPIGDRAIEDIFVMAAETGRKNIEVIMSPLDFRKDYDKRQLPTKPSWVSELYRQIEKKMTKRYMSISK